MRAIEAFIDGGNPLKARELIEKITPEITLVKKDEYSKSSSG